MAENDKSAGKSAGKVAAKRGKQRPEPGGGAIRPDRAAPKAPASDAKASRKQGAGGKAEVDSKAKGQIAELKRYLEGVRREYDRIIWPPKEKLAAATRAVLFILVSTTFVLWLIDMAIGAVFGFLVTHR